MLQVICFAAATVLSIVLGKKTKINVGIWALLFAFCLGIAFLDSAPTALLRTYFPVRVVPTVLVCMLFFSAVAQTGTITVFSRKVAQRIGGSTKLIALLIIYAMTIVLSMAMSASDGVMFALSPFAVGIALQLGMNPAVAIVAVWAGWTSVMMLPWTFLGVLNSSIAAGQFGDAVGASALLLYAVHALIFLTLTVLGMYFVVGKKALTDVEGDAGIATENGNVDFNTQQKLTIKVLAGILCLIILPTVVQLAAPNSITGFMSSRLDVVFWFSVGTIILIITGCADSRTVISNVPWEIIMLLFGVCTLFNLAEKLGITEVLGNLAASMPPILIAPVIALIGACLSAFVSGAVLGPFMIPMVGSLAAAAGRSPAFMIMVVLLGMAVSSISPASGAGATCLGVISNKRVADHISAQMAKMAVVNAFTFAVYIFVVQFVF